jgi:hypothetical protein
MMCIGGEPVSSAVLAKWLDRVQVVNQYGMGEVSRSFMSFISESIVRDRVGTQQHPPAMRGARKSLYRVPTLEMMCIGGEPVSSAVLAKWLDRVQVVNQYGRVIGIDDPDCTGGRTTDH